LVVESTAAEFAAIAPASHINHSSGSATPPPVTDWSSIADSLLSGEISRVRFNGAVYLSVDALNARAVAKLREKTSDAAMIPLLPDMEAVFKHFQFKADAVKHYLSKPNEPFELEIRDESPLRQAANLAEKAKSKVLIADDVLIEKLFNQADTSRSADIQALLLAPDTPELSLRNPKDKPPRR
jgi:hypothetical protein